VNAIYALYGDGVSAQRGVDALRGRGVADNDITIISAEPIEDHECGQIDRATHIWYIASAGGVLGLAIGTWLTRMTELAWPLPTGNMPIVAWWANLIVMFELTMLGAILATVGTVFVAGGLVRRPPRLYDRAVSAGQILVGVDNPQDSAAVEQALRSTAGEVKRL
jgi:hypothetical protein